MVKKEGNSGGVVREVDGVDMSELEGVELRRRRRRGGVGDGAGEGQEKVRPWRGRVGSMGLWSGVTEPEEEAFFLWGPKWTMSALNLTKVLNC